MAKDLSQLEKVIDLNKKLTAENTKLVTDIDGWIAEKIKHENEASRLRVENERLLTELEGITEDKNAAEQAYNNEVLMSKKWKILFEEQSESTDIYKAKCMRRGQELASIKSKWWYKLMTWGW